MGPKKYDKDLAILDGGWAAETSGDDMWRMLEEGHDSDPNNAALICKHQRSTHLEKLVGEPANPEGDLTWTYRQLMLGSKRLSSALCACGIKEGDTMVTFLPSCAEWVLCFWVAATLRLSFVPLDPSTLRSCCGTRAPAFDLMKVLSPAVAVVPTLKEACGFENVYGGLSATVPLKLVCHESDYFVYKSWTAFGNLHDLFEVCEPGTEEQDKPTRPLDEHCSDCSRIAVILFTKSNNNSPPKGCPLTVLNLKTTLVNLPAAKGRRYLVTGSSSSSMFLQTVMKAWHTGGTLVVPDGSYSLASTMKAIETCACTELICTLPHLQSLISDPEWPRTKSYSLANVTVVGGLMEGDVLEEVSHALVDIKNMLPSLCMSEGMATLGWGRIDTDDQDLNSVGGISLGARVKICDDQKVILKRDEEGNLHIGGKAMIDCYLDGQASESFYQDEDEETWFTTGFVAKIDELGLVHITGDRDPAA